MSKWKREGVFARDLGKITKRASCEDHRGVEHHVVNKGGILYHFTRGSHKIHEEKDWTYSDPIKISDTRIAGIPSIHKREDGSLQIIACREKSGLVRWTGRPEDFLDPAEEEGPEDPPVLRVSGEEFFYRHGGTVPIKFKGCAMREPLTRECGDFESWLDKSLDWYEDQLAFYAEKGWLNFVREDVCSSPQLNIKHAEFCYDHGIIWMATLWDYERPDSYGNLETNINILSSFPNVILQAGNEVLGNVTEEELDRIISCTDVIRHRGLISCAGAFGSGGEDAFKSLISKGLRPDVWSMHRPWDADDPEDSQDLIKNHINYLKQEFHTPVSWDESFRLEAWKISKMANIAFKAGLNAYCYYPDVGAYVDSLAPRKDVYQRYYEELKNIEI